MFPFFSILYFLRITNRQSRLFLANPGWHPKHFIVEKKRKRANTASTIVKKQSLEAKKTPDRFA